MKSLYIISFLILTCITVSVSYAQHSLQIDDGAGNTSTIVAPPTSTTFKLPTNTGGAGHVLTSDGAGGTSFQAPAVSFTPSFLYEYSLGFGAPLVILPNSNVAFNTVGVNTGAA